MPERHATLELTQHTEKPEPIVNLKFKGETILTISLKEDDHGIGVRVVSLYRLQTNPINGGAPGGGVDISAVVEGAGHAPRHH